MNKYDRILRENVEQVILPLSQKIFGFTPLSMEEVKDDTHVTLERRPDFVKIVTDKKKRRFLLHLEFQVKDETDMVLRMQIYKAMLQYKHQLPIIQFVLFLGEGKSYMKSRLTDFIPGETSDYAFHLKLLNAYDHKSLLKSAIPEEIILAVLADFKKEAPEKVIAQILERLQEVAKDEGKLQKYVRQLSVLSRLRNLVETTTNLIKVMPITYDIEKDPLFNEGIDKGVEQMIIKMLKAGLGIKEVVRISGMSIDDILEIQKQIQQQ